MVGFSTVAGSWLAVHITAKELILAAALCGHHWKQTCVRFRYDNMAIVDILKSRTSKDQLLAHLLHCLVFYAAFYHFDFAAVHIPGVLNVAADAISWDRISHFTTLIPQVPQVAIPESVLELLITKKPDWGSHD